MRLGDLTSAVVFRTSVKVAVGVMLLTGLGGAVLIWFATALLRADVERQALEEAVLFSDIYQSRGRAGLVQTIQVLETTFDGARRATGVFDENGRGLAGRVSELPSFVGVRDVRFEHAAGRLREDAGGEGDRFWLSVKRLQQTTLVVGHSLEAIYAARNRMISGVLLLSVLLSLGTVGLGLWASRRTLLKLQAMEAALGQVARGQTDQRLPVSAARDQIDRISVQINANLDHLSRLMDSIRSTATAIAHDLKTPLSHTLIALHEAVDAQEAGQDPLPKLEAALRETARLNEIFDAVLRISRIEATPSRLDHPTEDLNALAAQAVEFWAPVAEENGQVLALGAQGKVPLACDKAMVQQMLVNLVGNAVGHAGQGARITVTCAAGPAGVDLVVEDTGPGIPPDHHEEVFKPFRRRDSARRDPGSGLGLALVRAVIDHHGASIRLEDAAPGLKVCVQFPKPGV